MKIIITALVFVAVFVIFFLLYHIPVGAILYPAVICLLLGAALILTGYFRTKKNHDAIQRMCRLTAEMIEEIPADTVIENDLSELVSMVRQEVIRSRSEFAASYRNMVDYYTIWAHQIKTPISSMKLMLQGEDSDLARRLSADLFRIQQYVDMVLAFLRLEDDSNDYVFRTYNLEELIKPSVRKFGAEFIGRKLSLRIEPLEKQIITDEKWFAFLLEQIISNALKYTKTGSIKIYMPDENILCIEDTGIGIAAGDLPRIFEKGYTGYNGRTDKEATGLGLFLCKRICDNLGIGISIDSEVGVGTKVYINLYQKKLVTAD